jgi:L-alanine-DL-glutamate epimerase-like enolase superfamily enzyme
MKIESVDFYYVAMPVVTDEGDGSQDARLVRVEAGGHLGWGECEASPLVSITAFVALMSHGACRPVRDSVLGLIIEDPGDIAASAPRFPGTARTCCKAPHTFSGIEIALWDLLGKVRGEPVWRPLGHDRSHAKLPYASVPFGARYRKRSSAAAPTAPAVSPRRSSARDRSAESPRPRTRSRSWPRARTPPATEFERGRPNLWKRAILSLRLSIPTPAMNWNPRSPKIVRMLPGT